MRDAARLELLMIALWWVLTPSVLGFLAGWQLDKWGGAGWVGRFAFTLAGVLIGVAGARNALSRSGRRRPLSH